MILYKLATSMAVGLLTILSLVPLHAQDMSPSITVSGGFYPSQNLTDTTGSYSHQRAALGVTIPLLKKVKLNNDGLRFGLLSFSANTAIDNTDISFINGSRTLLMASASLTGIYKSGKKSTWLGKLTGSSFEDETTVRHPTVRLSGFALYKRAVRESFYYLLGGAYTFSFGRGLALPVIGAGWSFTNRSSFSFVLPLSLNYRFGKTGSQYMLFLRPSGGISGFYNNGLYPSASEKIIFRKREFTLGMHKKFKLSDHWSFFTEAGLLTARRISFNKDLTRNDDSVIFESKVHPGAYLSAGLKFKFNGKDIPDSDNNEYDLGF